MPPKSAKRRIVVDGSNIATEGRSAPNLAQLDQAIQAFLTEHPGFGPADVTVVVDATFGHRIDPRERPAFEQAIEHGEMVTPPAGAIGRGDGFILRIAEKSSALVLSNDSFQEFQAERPWLFEPGRLIGGKPVPGVGWVFTPRTPVRGPRSRAVTAKSRRESAAGTPANSSTTSARPEPTRPLKSSTAAKAATSKTDRSRADHSKADRSRAATSKTGTGKAEKAANPAKAAKTAKHPRVEQPSKSAKPTKANPPEKVTKLAKPAKPTKKIKAAKAVKAVVKAVKAAVKPTKPTKAAKVAKPAKAVKVVKAAKAPRGSGSAKQIASDGAQGGKSAKPKVGAASKAAKERAPKASPPSKTAKKTGPSAKASGATKPGGNAKAAGRAAGRGGAGGDGAAAASSMNDPMTFLTFVADHPIGSTLEGTVASFTSHGAHIAVGEMLCHIPLRGLARPAPTRARQVLTKGETRRFVLVSLDATHRRAELALPGIDR